MKNRIKKISWKNVMLYGSALGLATFIFVFLLTVNIIGYSVKEKCQIAKAKYDGTCVQALINYLDDENNDYRSRNSAVWALGQLGNSSALPTLQKYYTANILDREPLDKDISQYELKKAINLAEGNFNATAFFWRYGAGVE